MQIPQVPDRVKEAPAQALRAVFAGIGQLLLMADRIRKGEAEHARTEAAAADRADDDAGEPKAAVAAAKPPAARPPAAKPPIAKRPAAKRPAAKPPAAKPAAAKPPPALPVPNYDDLSLASLRGRLRNLDQAQLRVLVDYEQAHAGREAVVAMFERRIAKLEGIQD